MAVCEKCKGPCECKATAFRLKLAELKSQLNKSEPPKKQKSFETKLVDKRCTCSQCRRAMQGLPNQGCNRPLVPKAKKWQSVPIRKAPQDSEDSDWVHVSSGRVDPRILRRMEISNRGQRLAKVLDEHVTEALNEGKAVRDPDRKRRSREVMSLMVQLMSYFLILQSEVTADDVHQGFEEVGVMAGGLSYAHLQTRIHPKKILVDVMEEKVMLNKLANDTEKTFTYDWSVQSKGMRTIFGNSIEQINKDYDTICTRLEMWIDIFNPRLSRQKRQALALSLGLIGGLTSGYGFSLYSQTKITHLQTMVDENTDAIMQAINITEFRTSELRDNQSELDSKIRSINSTLVEAVRRLKVEEFTRILSRRAQVTLQTFREWEMGVISLLEGKASPYLFQPEYLRNELRELEKKVTDTQNEFLHSTMVGIYRFAVSLLAEKDGVSVFIHVPIVSTGILKLYRLQDTPFFDQGENVIYRFQTGKRVLAINEDHSRSLAISLAELNQCRRDDSMYYCDHHVVLNRKPELSCAGAIFVGNKEGIKTRCTIKVEEIKDVMQVLNRTAVRVFSTTGKVRIHNSCTSQQGMIESGQIVNLRPGCHAFSDNHWFGAISDESSVRDVVTSVVTMDHEILPLEAHEVGQVKRVWKELSDEGEAKVTFLKIRRRLQAKKVASDTGKWSITSFVLSIVAMLMVISLILYLTALGNGYNLNPFRLCSCDWKEQPTNQNAEEEDLAVELDDMKKS